MGTDGVRELVALATSTHVFPLLSRRVSSILAPRHAAIGGHHQRADHISVLKNPCGCGTLPLDREGGKAPRRGAVARMLSATAFRMTPPVDEGDVA